MENTINISFVTDNNYFKHMHVAIESVITNTSCDHLHFFIINMGISDDNIKMLQERYKNRNNVNFHFITVDKTYFSKYKIKTHVSSAAYAKIYMAELLHTIDTVIYLDCDLVVNSDISELWGQFDRSYALQAVWNPFYNYDNEYLGISDNRKTFNSGVMLLNLDYIRKVDATSELIHFVENNHNKTRLHDQAAFNAVFKDRWKELDCSWNCQVSMLLNDRRRLDLSRNEYLRLFKNSKIVHFTSNSKPWQFRNHHPYKRLYIRFYNEIYGGLKYRDISVKSSIQRIREFISYKYYYIKNLMRN